MKARGLGLLLLSCLRFASAESLTTAANPLQKVLQLLTELQGKVIADGEGAQKAYNDFTKWCGKTALQKQQQIKDGEAVKEELQAKIEKAQSDAEDASSQISALTGSIATDEADLKAASLLREKEHQDFLAMDKELASTIDTLKRARKLLETQLKDAGVTKASFLQRPTRGLELFRTVLAEVVNAAGLISEDDGAKVSAMVQELTAQGDADSDEEDDDALGAPAGDAYSSHSSGIVEAIKGMQQKAEQALEDARKKEFNQRLNYESFAQSLKAKIDVENKDLENTKSDLAKASEVTASATKALGKCTKVLAENRVAFEQLQRECMNRATEFSEAMGSKKAELEALAEAKKTIQDSSAGALLQTDSFAQVVAQRHHSSARLKRIAHVADDQVHKLRTLAKRIGSLALAQLASRISAAFRRGTGDPFEKVRGILENMVSKLQKEQKSEATQKQFCDQEMQHTKQTKDARSDDIEEMTGHVESMTAETARLQEDMKTLSEDASSASKSQAEMDRIRREEKEAFLKTESDLKQGLTGVQRALGILRDYYGGSSAGALLQEDVAASMAQEAQQQTAQQGSGRGAGGIIGLLEVVESDFAKSLTEAQAMESESASEYDKATQQNRVASAEIEATVKNKGQEMAKLRKSIAQVTSDRAEAQQELDAVNEYWAKLTKQCSQEQETYASRMAKREAEIRALQEALTTLEAA